MPKVSFRPARVFAMQLLYAMEISGGTVAEALPGNVNKLGDLLGRLGLRDRTADAEAIEAVLEQSVDYSEIDRLLLKERERSLEFLQENLKEELAGEET